MKCINDILADCRVIIHDAGEDGAAFSCHPRGMRRLNVIASNGGGWDHASVTPAEGSTTPTWAEMEAVRDLCFLPHETVVQFSPPRDQHINIHPLCLHLWRPQDHVIRLPPKEFV